MKDVTVTSLRRPGETEKWAKINRSDYLNHTFVHRKKHKKGSPDELLNEVLGKKLNVEALGTGDNINKYMCRLVGGGKTNKKDYMFDVGYIQRVLFKAFFPLT